MAAPWRGRGGRGRCGWRGARVRGSRVPRARQFCACPPICRSRAAPSSPRLSPRMNGLIFHLIAHTHWDREWYRPRAAFQARLVPMLDDLIERLQADAAYRSFLLDGQTVLLEDYLRVRPDREADLKALVKT